MPCPRTQQANLPACSPQPPLNAKRQAGKLRMPFFKVIWYDSTRGMNPTSTDCEADALTTTPSRRLYCSRINVLFPHFHIKRKPISKSSMAYECNILVGPEIAYFVSHLYGILLIANDFFLNCSRLTKAPKCKLQ